MEGTIGEVRLFAGNFAPKNWALCQGQIIQIRSNTALFAVLGTQYGGDGTNTFGLPNLMSRTAIGAGSGQGLTPYIPGQTTGTESVTLNSTQLPMHIHVAIATQGAPGTASAAMYGVETSGTLDTPGGDYPAQDGGSGGTPYATPGTGTASSMAAGSVTVGTVTAPLPSVTLLPNGGNQPHENRQPLLALNYIICLQGYFPPRN